MSEVEKVSKKKRKAEKKEKEKLRKKSKQQEENEEFALSQEQARAERKAEKKRKKQERRSKKDVKEVKKLEKEEEDATEKEKDPLNHPAIKYLETFSKDKANWKFAKTRQMYLIKNVYNMDNIPKSHFKMLLEYLEGLKGAARENTVKEAKKHVENFQNAESSGVEEGKLKNLKKLYKRADKILALLS